MKNTFYLVLTSFLLTISSGSFAQAPPSPNNGNDAGSGNTPVGGNAPIGSGLGIMIALATAYGLKSFYNNKESVTLK